ncbi:MAG: cell division protein SepF [Eubacterium sp.]|nr:cell division protein SepF [Eubacterium sp.]
MGFFDKVKEIIGDDEDDFEEYYDETEGFDVRSSRQERSERRAAERAERDRERSSRSESVFEREERERPVRRSQKSDKVLNIHTTTQLQVVLVTPERFDEAPKIADHLNERRTVVLNLESTNRDIARRLLDFLSGVAYANSGQIKRVANSTYIITPYDVDVMGDLLDELENNGMFI